MSTTYTVINYCLNRFFPPILLALLIIPQFELNQWELYAAVGLLFFMDRFQFKVGYSVGYCEANGIDPCAPSSKLRKKNIQESEDSVDDR